MRNFTKYLISVSAALYFLLAGTGFNIVNYCCQSCEIKGIELIAEQSCATVHVHEKGCTDDCCAADIDFSCEDLHHIFNGCHLYRATTEIPVFTQETFSFDSPANAFISDFQLFQTANITFSLSAIENFIPDSFTPLPTGRKILSNKSVLII